MVPLSTLCTQSSMYPKALYRANYGKQCSPGLIIVNGTSEFHTNFHKVSVHIKITNLAN